MVEILGTDLGVQLPSLGGGLGLGNINWVLILSIFLFFVIGAIVIFILLDRKKFNKKVIVFENISGQGYQQMGRDRARLVKIGDGGEEILFLKKAKVFRTAYGKKMGKNTYWFAKGQDGYWYNIVIGDLDAKMGMLDIEPIDRDMRYMHVAIRKNIQERYQKQNFMEKYGTIMMNGIFLLIMLIGIGILISKMASAMETLNLTMEASRLTIEQINQMLGGVDNICTGSSRNLIN
ncbi:hypothetical protein HN865_03590 [Candidatus Woesearchaeota archaeon]|jgi:hypothetical protein|nr:hypothetical protein [archaeon]MBT7237914.1 hypothetical protein [Candidatus Woesearchaeota archaeon]